MRTPKDFEVYADIEYYVYLICKECQEHMYVEDSDNIFAPSNSELEALLNLMWAHKCKGIK